MVANLSTISAPDSQGAVLHMPWTYEASWMTSADYFTKYQEWIKSNSDPRGFNTKLQVIDAGPVLPFQLIGGAFVSKAYLFEEVGIAHVDAENLSGKEATLELRLRTNTGTKSWFFQLTVPELSSSQVIYANVVPIKSSR
jgi:hypothetical protein